MAYTVAQMHKQFKDELDKVDSLSVPNFLPTEIDRFLNDAQETFIKERLPASRTKATTVEETQRRRDDLRNITSDYSTSTFTSSSANKPNGKTVSLPSDYKYSLEEEVSGSYKDACGDTVTGRIPVRPITHDQYNSWIRDPFAKPYESEVWELPLNGSLELIPPAGMTLSTFYMRYLKEPARISLTNPVQDCVLGDTPAKEIVKIAVAETLRVIEDPRFKTQKQDLMTTE